MRPLRAGTALAALAIALGAPGASHAAGVAVAPTAQGPEIVYAAAAGEANDLDVSVEATGAVRFADRVAIAPGPGCTPVGPTVARCAVSGEPGLRINVGDGNDAVRVRGIGARLFGGAGNDTLQGANEPNRFDGGPGNDELSGGTASDFFDEGPQANGSDVLVGNSGGGSDEVSYAKRSRGVVADLTGDRDDGEAGENDEISYDIEELSGGRGDDRLSGNLEDNSIRGRGGSDVIKGRAGDDSLAAGTDLFGRASERSADRINGGSGIDTVSGSAGDNRLSGGPNPDVVLAGGGDDRISERDKRIDQIACGAGTDRVKLDGFDFFASACERVRRTFKPAAIPLELNATAARGGTAFVEIGCPGDGPKRCRGRASLLYRGASLGSDRFGVGNGGRHDAVIDLPDSRVAELRKGVNVAVRVRSRDAQRRLRTIRVRLRLPAF